MGDKLYQEKYSEIEVINLLLEHVVYSNNLGASLLFNGNDAEAIETLHFALSSIQQTSKQLHTFSKLSSNKQFDRMDYSFASNNTAFFADGDNKLHCSGLDLDDNNFYIYDRIITLCPLETARTFQNYSTMIQYFIIAISFNLALCYHKNGLRHTNNDNAHALNQLNTALKIYDQVLQICKDEDNPSISITGSHLFCFMIAATYNNQAQIHRVLGHQSKFHDLIEEIECEITILKTFDQLAPTGVKNDCVRQIWLNTITTNLPNCISAPSA